jgi:hypothetical protein
VCHMPITHYDAMTRGERARIFAHLPFEADPDGGRQAADGVSCSVCHQITPERLGTPESYNGNFVVAPPGADGLRPEYGPYDVENGQQRVMTTSTEGYRPTQSPHVRESQLCASCHTLLTKALGPGGQVIGQLPEQVPYQEWLHSEFKDRQSCQSCHMPEFGEDVPITRVFGVPRAGARHHVFVGANFLMQRILNRYRGDLGVQALPQELTSAADRTVRFLETQAAQLDISQPRVSGGRLQADVTVRNIGGHKLPTAYPARRAWLHILVRDRDGNQVFESGRLNPDGSIVGNDNDVDRSKYEPHYAEITQPDQVQIYESILGGPNGDVTTGLLTAVGYLKDNRLLPRGFDKTTADEQVAVHGAALKDADFNGDGDRIRFAVPVNEADGPFRVTAELMYQPIGYRWANNLNAYDARFEPKRFTGYYDAMKGQTAVTLARAER